MGWIVLLVVVSVVISSLKKKMKEAASENRQPTSRTANQPISKEEQVRRVRAEIQRTIQERQQRDRQAKTALEMPRIPPVLPENEYRRPEARSAPVPPAIPPPLPTDTDEALERQRALAERIRELEARHARGPENTVTADSLRWDAALPVAQMGAGAIRTELRDVRSVRRAIILREVLGTPVGLR